MDRKEMDYLEQRFTNVMKQGGKLVKPEHGDARLNKCKTRNNGKPCEFLGKVEPLPNIEIETGCQKCGCALNAKAYMEYLGIKLLNKKIECPHPDGNQWAEIDEIFFNH